ncbi:MAG TPA: MMPL family transporter [Gemmataceae bacterium]|jgi:RND superfamily putative drug exporter|nr:MMPL family transporter [Gemmataceae bacterium]
MFKGLGRLTTAHPWAVCFAWVVAGIVLRHLAPNWDVKSQDDDIHFLPDRCASVRGFHLLEKAFPQDVFASRAILAVERPESFLTEGDFRLVDQCVNDLQELRRADPDLQIGSIWSYRDGIIGNRLISEDKRCTLIQVALGTPFLALQTRATVDRIDARLKQRLAALGPQAPTARWTGPAGLGRDLIQASGKSLEGTTIATIVLVIVILLMVYRAPLLALIPLITIAVSVWISLQGLALITLIPGVHLVNISKVFAIVILYGAGTDYCLFLISRYREELVHHADTAPAIRQSLCEVGGALTASAGTVICGLGLMGFAEFAKVRCAGPAIALSLVVALLGSLTLAPALLQILGRTAFWPARGPVYQAKVFPGFRRETLWERISRGVIARPVLVWSTAMVALLPLAFLGFRVSPNYKSTGELPPWAESVQGVQTIQRHFTAGEVGPMTVLLTSSTDWSSPQGRELIAHLSRGFGFLDNVAEVRSLTQPLGKSSLLGRISSPTLATSHETGASTPTRIGAASNGLFKGVVRAVHKEIDLARNQADKAAREFYVAKVPGETKPTFVTRLDVVLQSDPFDPVSFRTLETIQVWLRDEMPQSARQLTDVGAECYGVTVGARDLATITEGDRLRVNFLVLSGIFLILLVLVRRIWLAGYLLVTVLFSYYVTLGATVLVGTLWSGRPLDQVEWRVPFFLFTILIAVGEDYNILLITRVIQEKSKYGVKEGIRRALGHTGGTITSCGLIMAGTFATLMLAGLGTLVQIGFALAIGVLLDSLVVRPFLVPAFALMVWREETKEPTDEEAIIAFPPRRRKAA